MFEGAAPCPTTYAGIYCADGSEKTFWRFVCPCGITAEYGLTEIPAVDTPFPCGHPDHWVVKYGSTK